MPGNSSPHRLHSGHVSPVEGGPHGWKNGRSVQGGQRGTTPLPEGLEAIPIRGSVEYVQVPAGQQAVLPKLGLHRSQHLVPPG